MGHQSNPLFWVDFINTVKNQRGNPVDDIGDLALVSRWLEETAVEEADRRRIEAEIAALPAHSHPNAHQRILVLRQELRNLANHLADSASDLDGVLRPLNERLGVLLGTWHLMSCNGAVRPQFTPAEQAAPDALSLLEWMLLQSAMAFLDSMDVHRLKPCAGHNCIQYFYDTSKSNTRRWCQMGTCGNQAKARRHYAKKRAQSV